MTVTRGNPFPGPRPYSAEQREFFFGREQASARLKNRALARPCMVLYGPSGAGKSSLMQAVVLPELAREFYCRVVSVERWPAGTAPTDVVLEHLCGALGLPDELLDESVGLAEAVEFVLTNSERTLVFFLDQLEQILFPGKGDRQARRLFEELEKAAHLRLGGVHIILGIREDYLGLLRDRARGQRVLLDDTFRLGPLTVAEMTDAVVQAVRWGTPPQDWERGEIEELVRQMRSRPEIEPGPDDEVEAAFVQIVCLILWENRAAGRARVGGAREILDSYLEDTIAELEQRGADVSRFLESQMIDDHGNRALVTEVEALKYLAGDYGPEILRGLETAAILRGEEHHKTRRYELGHDWLAEKLLARRAAREERDKVERTAREERDRLERAVREERERLEQAALEDRKRLEQAALEERERLERAALEERERLEQAAQQERAERERAEKARIAAQEEFERRRRRRWARIGVVALALGFVAAVVVGVVIESERRAAQKSEQDAHLAKTSVEASLIENTKLTAELKLANEQTRRAALIGGVRELLALGQPDRAALLLREVPEPEAGGGWMSLAQQITHGWVPYRTFGGQDVAVDLTRAFRRVNGKWVVQPVPNAERDREGETGSKSSAPLKGGSREPSKDRLALQVAPITVSGDGRTVAVGASDGIVRVWRAELRDAPPRVLLGHSDAVLTAAISEDGSYLVTGSLDKTVRVWPLDGEGDPEALTGHDGAVLAVSIHAKTRRVVSASLDGTARVWSLDAPERSIVLRKPEGPVLDAEFSPDGATIATGSVDGQVRLWRAHGKGASVLLGEHKGAVRSVAFDAEGRQIVSASSDHTARVWQADRKRRPEVLEGHADVVVFAAFGHGGTDVITASRDRSARRWYRPFRDEGFKERWLMGHERAVRSVVVSPDGDRLLTIAGGSEARVWDQTSSARLPVSAPEREVALAAFAGYDIVVASSEGTVQQWRLWRSAAPRTGRRLSTVFFASNGSLVELESSRAKESWRDFYLHVDGREYTFSSTGESTFGSSWNGRRFVLTTTEGAWVYSPGEPEGLVKLATDRWIKARAFSRDGELLVTVAADGQLTLWQGDGRAPIRELGRASMKGDLLAVSDDKRWVVIHTSSFGTAWRPISAFEQGARASVELVSLDGEGSRVLTHDSLRSGSADEPVAWAANSDGETLLSFAEGQVWIWSIAGGKVVRRFGEGITGVRVSEDGLQVLTKSEGEVWQLWSVYGEPDEEPQTFEHQGPVHDANFDEFGTRVVTAGEDGDVKIWSIGKREPILVIPHSNPVEEAKFVPGGASIATISKTGLVRVWDAEAEGEPLLEQQDPGGWPMRFSPDGTRVLMASFISDGYEVWELTTKALHRRLGEVTSNCLPAQLRVNYLGETAAEAVARYEACERGHDRREPGGAGGPS